MPMAKVIGFMTNYVVMNMTMAVANDTGITVDWAMAMVLWL